MSLYKFIPILAAVLLSCEEDKTDYEAVAASEAAKEYYSSLSQGKDDEFTNGFARMKEYPEECRDEFRRNTEDFIKVQNERHRGITAVEISSAERDSINNTINVFLSVNYGDSTQERVVVPMVKDNYKWLMK